MRFEPTQVDELRLHYELALAIGTSLDTKVMLRRVLQTFIRMLNCAAGSIYLMSPDGRRLETRYAIPRDIARNQSCKVVRAFAEELQSDLSLDSLRGVLPVYGGNRDQGFHHILELPGGGLISLVRHGEPLHPSIVRSLEPLLDKLANACVACLKTEELTRIYRDTKLERNMLRALIEHTPIIVFAVDRDGVFRISEGYGLQQVGRTPGQAVGRSIFDLYQHVPEITHAVRNALDGMPCSLTVQLSGRSFDARYEPLFDEYGAIDGVVGIAHDVTERKAAADALGVVLNTVGEGIITIDSGGNIVMVNREVEKIFGHDHHSLVGNSILMLMPAKYRSLHLAGMHRYQTTGDSTILGRRVEVEGLRGDGSVFPLELRIQEFRTGGSRLFSASMRDISDRKEIERMRDDFVSTISHELRTPLAAIMGWTETLKSGRPGPLSEKQERFLNIIYHGAERLNTLVQEILTVSHIQRGTFQLSRAPFYPHSILDNAVAMVRPVAASHGVKIHITHAWPPDISCVGDGERMEQVIVNLVENAVKFSPDKGEIHIHSARDGNSWHVDVSDQGIGIADEEIEHIFERFFRAKSAKRAEIQGSGIGLFICKAIVDKHHGRIDVASELGKGTTISFSIPIEGPDVSDPSECTE